jgi:catechol 2,3-dioxygenase-like lactoylglutathione lyase family enzyme
VSHVAPDVNEHTPSGIQVAFVDHLGVTVPDLDAAVDFFVAAFGAEELYRSTRRGTGDFMSVNFGVGADSALELAMLRLPPNLNMELFEWSGAGRLTHQPRPCDVGSHHLCFSVLDIDVAVEKLALIPGVRVLGQVKTVGADSPSVAGNRWIYLDTPWGMRIELVDRTQMVDPPALVGLQPTTAPISRPEEE